MKLYGLDVIGGGGSDSSSSSLDLVKHSSKNFTFFLAFSIAFANLSRCGLNIVGGLVSRFNNLRWVTLQKILIIDHNRKQSKF